VRSIIFLLILSVVDVKNVILNKPCLNQYLVIEQLFIIGHLILHLHGVYNGPKTTPGLLTPEFFLDFRFR